MASITLLDRVPAMQAGHLRRGAPLRGIIIALTAFLTLVDLFATQAILPALATEYGVSPAAMGAAVNATTFGMAVACIGVAALSRRIDRRLGVSVSLVLLAVPTALLASAPSLAAFAVLRVAQGAFMAAAFTLMLAHLGERCSATDAAGAFAAYVTGNVASNLVGRLLSAGIADHLGLAANFYGFALLNLAGAALVAFTLRRAPPMEAATGAHVAVDTATAPVFAWREHLHNGQLRTVFAIGFCILFAFIGAFSYVNFELVREPYSLPMMGLGLVYLVFLPSVLTTPLAGRAVRRFGDRPTFWGALALAGAGLPLLLAPLLTAVLAGLALLGMGMFLAQAVATGIVGRVATGDRGSASGMYLASYFAGGLASSAALGWAYEAFGWEGCVVGIGAALAVAAFLALRVRN